MIGYSSDPSWDVDAGTTSKQGFDCREFKFWLNTNFWVVESSSAFSMGTLNWTMKALDGTMLGGSPQDDIMAFEDDQPAMLLTSMLDDVVKVYWNSDGSMTFGYGTQILRYPIATGEYVGTFVGSAAMANFTWTTSGVL